MCGRERCVFVHGANGEIKVVSVHTPGVTIYAIPPSSRQTAEGGNEAPESSLKGVVPSSSLPVKRCTCNKYTWGDAISRWESIRKITGWESHV
jgi:hypothetical protein